MNANAILAHLAAIRGEQERQLVGGMIDLEFWMSQVPLDNVDKTAVENKVRQYTNMVRGTKEMIKMTDAKLEHAQDDRWRKP